MITDIIGNKRIDLAYLIWGKEVAVVSMFSDSIQYDFTENWDVELESGNKEIMAEAIHTRRALINFVKEKIEITQFDKNPRIIKINKSEGITEVVFNLDELDKTNNLENRKPSNTLLGYHVTPYEDSTHFGPYTPQYKKL